MCEPTIVDQIVEQLDTDMLQFCIFGWQLQHATLKECANIDYIIEIMQSLVTLQQILKY